MTWLDDKLDQENNPAAPSTPARVIGTAWRPSTTKYTLVQITLQLVATHGQDGTVELRSDAASTPTTARASTRLAVTDAAAGATMCQQLSYLVPPGHYVKLVAAGTGTPTIVNQVETALS